MKSRIKIASFLAWLFFGIVLVVAVATLPDSFRSSNLQGSLLPALNTIFGLLIVLAFPLVGALIISRQPKNTIGWLLMLPALASLPDPFIHSQIVGLTVPPPHPSILFMTAAYLSNTTWLVGIFPIFFIALLFPTGKPLSPGWRWAVVYASGIFAIFIFIAAFGRTIAPDSSLYGVDWTIPNPIGFLNTTALDNLFSIWIPAMAGLAILCVVSIVVRYRRAAAVERQQIRWILYALGLFGAVYVPYTLFQSWRQIWGVVINIVFLTIPVAIGIAILRYRLFDIDIIIRKTLQYALITGLLALVYFGSVVLLQSIFRSVTGGQSPAVIVISTLLIAALFTPLRGRVQELIDRRFFRKKYNAQQVLAAFALTARDEVDMDALTAALLRVVDETMQPEQLSLLMLSPKETG